MAKAIKDKRFIVAIDDKNMCHAYDIVTVKAKTEREAAIKACLKLYSDWDKHNDEFVAVTSWDCYEKYEARVYSGKGDQHNVDWHSKSIKVIKFSDLKAVPLPAQVALSYA